jgi:hypothetical protein
MELSKDFKEFSELLNVHQKSKSISLNKKEKLVQCVSPGRVRLGSFSFYSSHNIQHFTKRLSFG